MDTQTSSKAEVERPQILEALDELEGEVNMLSELVNVLDDKLRDITREELEKENPERIEERKIMVPLGETIMSHARHIGHSRSRIRSVLNRIEL